MQLYNWSQNGQAIQMYIAVACTALVLLHPRSTQTLLCKHNYMYGYHNY